MQKIFPPCSDEYISFEKTNYKNPYTNLCLLEMEDIFGYMLSYKRPFTKGDIGYLIRKRKKLHTDVCKFCYRLPENRQHQPYHLRPNVTLKRMDVEASKEEGSPVTFEVYEKDYLTCDGCRVMKLKQSMNREINDPFSCLRRVFLPRRIRSNDRTW